MATTDSIAGSAQRHYCLQVSILCVVGAAIYLWRMHRFAVHFAREVFTGFLTLQSGVNGNAKIEN
jgi:hypothetical protein